MVRALMSIAEAAATMGVTAETVRRWVREGRIEASKTAGGFSLITPEEVERFQRERDAQ